MEKIDQLQGQIDVLRHPMHVTQLVQQWLMSVVSRSHESTLLRSAAESVVGVSLASSTVQDSALEEFQTLVALLLGES